MKRTLQIIITTLLSGLMLTVIANERDTNAGSYDGTGSVSVSEEITAESTAGNKLHNYEASEALLQLRANQDVRYRSLKAEILLAQDSATREVLELKAMALQAEFQKAELELLLSEALADENYGYAVRLQDVLDHGLEPTQTSQPGATVQRDPVTGRVLSGEEGGTK
jgi:hypothetical protein